MKLDERVQNIKDTLDSHGQRCTNPVRQFAVTLNICGSSLSNLLRVTLWRLEF